MKYSDLRNLSNGEQVCSAAQQLPSVGNDITTHIQSALTVTDPPEKDRQNDRSPVAKPRAHTGRSLCNSLTLFRSFPPSRIPPRPRMKSTSPFFFTPRDHRAWYIRTTCTCTCAWVWPWIRASLHRGELYCDQLWCSVFVCCIATITTTATTTTTRNDVVHNHQHRRFFVEGWERMFRIWIKKKKISLSL